MMDADKVANFFPLTCRKDVLNLINSFITSKSPDPVMISLILGKIEHELTQFPCKNDSSVNDLYSKVDFKELKTMHNNYLEYLRKPVLIEKTFTNDDDDDEEKTICGRNKLNREHAQTSKREKIKEIYNKVWFKLARSYRKDRHHMQTIYSLLNDQKLDCFGVSISVVLSCHLLDLRDVTLVMSEDHSWIEFNIEDICNDVINNDINTTNVVQRDTIRGYDDEVGRQSMEVTWHGKQTKDKRGCRVVSPEKRWLTSGGQAVRCKSGISLVAAMVCKMNPIIDAGAESKELLALKFVCVP
ncbi:hypothetical protein HELRODRAFT_193799 [Helobdella robusta]|uniref:Menin n=1 Tax=Helobdella robusta TaxID=6412 RepID=T1FVD2_HELRO|nr:hypothetical protein HELRODRAFT_193799 [Helobdella robusta]ESN94814.1 hypothetical protein HELRODRAFT_193799 [Helobdella robusta]